MTTESGTGIDVPAADETGTDEISWTMLELDELVDVYQNKVYPAMRADGLNPESDRPTHRWLSENGFRGLIYTLREYHDLSFGEFWEQELGFEESDDQYEWGTNDDTTIELLEAYLESRRVRGNLSESSQDTLRYRLAKYIRAYQKVSGTDDLIAPVAPDCDTPAHEATEVAWRAFDSLNEDLSPRTMRRVHEAVDDWYSHLVRRKRVTVNPVAGLEDEYRWNRRSNGSGGQASNPALAPDHVQALYEAARTPADRLQVVALCAWGLRSGEVARLHRSQINDGPDQETPYVSFENRKNGPGEVSILFGRSTVEDRIIELGEKERWNGYLFPSKRSSTGHITRQTVLNRFNALASQADLPDGIDGQKPVPQMGRRFWYDAYSATQEALLEEVGEIAAEQGSASAEVVLTDYLSENRRRQLRRQYMREQLAAAFGDESQ